MGKRSGDKRHISPLVKDGHYLVGKVSLRIDEEMEEYVVRPQIGVHVASDEYQTRSTSISYSTPYHNPHSPEYLSFRRFPCLCLILILPSCIPGQNRDSELKVTIRYSTFQ